jgi:hypothetical protein
MNTVTRSMVPPGPYKVEQIAPGVRLQKLYPGGKAGPNNETADDIPGGQNWAEIVMLGDGSDGFIMGIPDIRMPPNQFWPMHWHDCWTVVVTLEGNCMVGDWYMEPGDVFIAAPSIEYGPLLPGPKGTRILEIFADLALSPGGYGPEYHNHPTLVGGPHVFKEREGINKRNEGQSALTVAGTSGMWQSRLSPGWSWDLGEANDPDRGIVRYTVLAAGEKIAAKQRGDWYGGLILGGSGEIAGKQVGADDVIIGERDAEVPELVASDDGIQILEHFRTARAL